MPKPIKQIAEPKVYIVWAKGQAGPSIIEAYSPGHAIEFFLATHGMFGYSEPIKIAVVDGNVDLISSVSKLIPLNEIAGLDEHHAWKIVELIDA